MSTTAIVMMALFMVFLWGGLFVATINLRNHSDEESGELGTAPGTTDEDLIFHASSHPAG
ncbi:MAG: methionine/alanine import NSS transporter subunit MetS [Corynebacterium sp.]|uniref:methionine/alanine import NSS transporter subunit MetS n=1 Tax=unclassified Corynebacterium TaxID=2624378 RepID=UPI002649A96C|nr:methionine/alanine import NSS transporter subunit MetS [Corynebacterium sp.]MDN5720848.1 methionine/alanine import NSS transporter subunit MetS [Corynebacterium sp.]MDN6258576.1 methionine/alanine import NSS transporter subunit MetS [Corynebacterium sp.]MDN6324287.1 methionine/alanine import NSS transporter subunit MetS [Corynebacterium sp.]MDN6387161.1 methionine/alanine import NSS transporter subunit MetS [Corynebacterium sp.]